MTAAPPVVVVGDLVTDVVARLCEPLSMGSDATAAVRATGGGSGANVAAWLAATGADVAFVGRVGDDGHAGVRAAELGDAGVRLFLSVDRHSPTGTIVVIVTPDGERTMLPDRGANLSLSPGDLPAHLFTTGSHLHLSGYSLFAPGPRAAGLEALRRARDAGMTISVDPSSAQPLRTLGPSRFLRWTDGADLCLPNLAEAAVLTGTPDVEQAALALASRYGQVAITLGREGAVWSDGHRLLRCPAPAGAVRDTTGAGDAFTAGFLHALLEGRPVPDRLAEGSRLAGLAIAVDGGRPPA